MGVETGRAVEGQVRALTTGKPLAGFRVSAHFGFGDGVQAVTDADGRYRLEGLPQDKSYQGFAPPGNDSPDLRRSAPAEAPPATAPVRPDAARPRATAVAC